MTCPKTFFDFNDAYIRISEIVAITRDGRMLIVTLRGGMTVRHSDYNGSAAAIERRLIEAISALEG